MHTSPPSDCNMDNSDEKFQEHAKEMNTILALGKRIQSDESLKNIMETRFTEYRSRAFVYDYEFFSILRSSLHQETKKSPRVIVSLPLDYPFSMKPLRDNIELSRVREYIKEGFQSFVKDDAIALLITDNHDWDQPPFIVTVVWNMPLVRFLSSAEKQKCTDKSTLLVLEHTVPTAKLTRTQSKPCGPSSSSS